MRRDWTSSWVPSVDRNDQIFVMIYTRNLHERTCLVMWLRHLVVRSYPKFVCSDRRWDLRVVQGDHEFLMWGCISRNVQQLSFARISWRDVCLTCWDWCRTMSDLGVQWEVELSVFSIAAVWKSMSGYDFTMSVCIGGSTQGLSTEPCGTLYVWCMLSDTTIRPCQRLRRVWGLMIVWLI